MTTASDLADRIEELAMGATARPWALTPSDDGRCAWEGDRDKSAADLALVDTLVNRLPEILSALRRVEKLEAALREIAEIGDEAKRHHPQDDFDRGSRAARGEAADIARQAIDRSKTNDRN